MQYAGTQEFAFPSLDDGSSEIATVLFDLHPIVVSVRCYESKQKLCSMFTRSNLARTKMRQIARNSRILI